MKDDMISSILAYKQKVVGIENYEEEKDVNDGKGYEEY